MGAWDYAHWIRNEKIKNLKKKICRGFPYKRNWRRFSLRNPLSKVSPYLKLKVKYDDVMPINSHVTSEEGKRKLQPKYSNPKKLVRSESLKWCHKLRRSHSKMELYNIYSHQMAINTHYIHERTIVLYSHSKEKINKKNWKKKFRKKI